MVLLFNKSEQPDELRLIHKRDNPLVRFPPNNDERYGFGNNRENGTHRVATLPGTLKRTSDMPEEKGQVLPMFHDDNT